MIKISKIFGDFVPREFSVGQGLLQTSRHFENRRGEDPGDEVETATKAQLQSFMGGILSKAPKSKEISG